MCNTNNIPSFKERVQCYINKEDEIKKDYQNRINALNEAATADILVNCPIKVGDVIGQLEIPHHRQICWDVVNNLEDLGITDRGDGGFGSTAKK